MATGVTRYSGQDLLAVPAQRKDGRSLSIEFTIQLIRRFSIRVNRRANLQVSLESICRLTR